MGKPEDSGEADDTQGDLGKPHLWRSVITAGTVDRTAAGTSMTSGQGCQGQSGVG